MSRDYFLPMLAGNLGVYAGRHLSKWQVKFKISVAANIFFSISVSHEWCPIVEFFVRQWVWRKTTTHWANAGQHSWRIAEPHCTKMTAAGQHHPRNASTQATGSSCCWLAKGFTSISPHITFSSWRNMSPPPLFCPVCPFVCPSVNLDWGLYAKKDLVTSWLLGFLFGSQQHFFNSQLAPENFVFGYQQAFLGARSHNHTFVVASPVF